MSIKNRVAITGLVCCFALSVSFAMPKGGNGNGKGGDGGDDNSALRLCADFSNQIEPYLNDDGRGTYCDGTDGEIQVSEGLVLSTERRNTEGRLIAAKFHGSYCDVTRTDPQFPNFAAKNVDMNLGAVFGWQKSEFTGCNPGDPFAAGFIPNKLECLSDSGVDLNLRSMLNDGSVRYMSWRVHLFDPEVSLKKGGEAMVLGFGTAIGPTHQCEIPDGDTGTSDGGLPIAIKCTDDDGTADPKCTAWQVNTFRACAFDYNTAKGGNWNWGGDGCPVNSEISFTELP